MLVVYSILSLLLGADIKVAGAETAPVGSFVLIDASESTCELTWTVPDKEVSLFLIGDNCQAILYSPTAKRCRYTVAAKDASGMVVSREVLDFTGDDSHPARLPRPRLRHRNLSSTNRRLCLKASAKSLRAWTWRHRRACIENLRPVS